MRKSSNFVKRHPLNYTLTTGDSLESDLSNSAMVDNVIFPLNNWPLQFRRLACRNWVQSLGPPNALVAKGRDKWCDKSLWHVATTGCCNKSPRVSDMWTSSLLQQNFVAAICRMNSNWFEFVRHIDVTKQVQAALSQRVYASVTSCCDKI